MWDANIGTTTRFLDAAEAAERPRIVYVSTVGDLRQHEGPGRRRDVPPEHPRGLPQLVRRDEVRRARGRRCSGSRTGAPIVIVLPEPGLRSGRPLGRRGAARGSPTPASCPYRALDGRRPRVRPRRRPRGRHRGRARPGRSRSVVRPVRPASSAAARRWRSPPGSAGSASRGSRSRTPSSASSRPPDGSSARRTCARSSTPRPASPIGHRTNGPSRSSTGTRATSRRASGTRSRRSLDRAYTR